MLLGFKRRFAGYVEEGSKRHTVRGIRAVRPRIGETAHCYVDPRQKSMRLLGWWPLVRVQDIRLQLDDRLAITIDGVELTPDEAQSFAHTDGFRGSLPILEMLDFWRNNGRLLTPEPWDGVLIHWDFERPIGAKNV